MLKERAKSDGSPGQPPDECGGCGGRIQDRFYLLAVDRQWHAACLRCYECKLRLDTELSCFSREGNIYCKEDYYRMFCIKRCARCGNGISPNELVMRARELVYHIACFTCGACGAHLSKGDMFGVRDGLVYCRPHYDAVVYNEACMDDDMNAMYGGYTGNGERLPPGQYFSPAGPIQKGRPRKRKVHATSPDELHSMRIASSALDILQRGELSSSMESLSYESSIASPGSTSGHHSQRTKRMRTSFKHHQLRTMKSYFAINQNPDAKDLKQLAQKTGLSKRVLQVWFQNARAKWRRNLMRQESGGQIPGTGVPGVNSVSIGSQNVISSTTLIGESSNLTSLSNITAHQQLEEHRPRIHTGHGMSFEEIY